MIEQDLEILGRNIAQLRLARQLKQSELAYEAGVSKRTLQRIEAGEVVKTDGLLKVIRQLGRAEEMLSATAPAAFSPYQLATELKTRQRGRHSLPPDEEQAYLSRRLLADKARKRVRHRRVKKQAGEAAPQNFVWPEDQE